MGSCTYKILENQVKKKNFLPTFSIIFRRLLQEEEAKKRKDQEGEGSREGSDYSIVVTGGRFIGAYCSTVLTLLEAVSI